MSIKSILRATFAWACLICAATPASADMLLSYESGSTGNLSSPGMAIDLTSGSYSVTSFNWLTGSTVGSETPVAFGTLYIIQTTASALNTGSYDSGIMPNSNGTLSSPLPAGDTVIGSAVASGNTYSFSPGVTLNANTVYYFFSAGGTPDENASGNPSPPVTLTGDSGTVSAQLTRYRAPAGSNPDFVSAGGLYDFQLTGTLVPEPSTMAMLGSGALATGFFGGWRLRNRKKGAA